MKLKQCIRDCDSGFTILELLVATSMSLLIIGGAIGGTLSLRSLYAIDLSRTRLNQDMRSSIDFVGVYLRQAGERLPSGVLAIEIIDGTAGAPDELILRRNLLDEVLTVCQTIPANSSDTKIHLSTSASGVSPACVYGGQAQNFSAWQAHRSAEGGTVKVYIYNLATQDGEFVDYVSESDTGLSMSIDRATGPITHQYDAESSAVYVMLEWRFRLSTLPSSEGVLEVIENEDLANPLRVAFGVTDFQLQAILQSGTVLTSFGSGDAWSELEAIEVSVSGSEQRKSQSIDTQLTSRFFPRNILSL